MYRTVQAVAELGTLEYASRAGPQQGRVRVRADGQLSKAFGSVGPTKGKDSAARASSTLTGKIGTTFDKQASTARLLVALAPRPKHSYVQCICVYDTLCV